MILKLNLENEEEINVLKKLVSRESPSDTWSPEIQLGPLPPKDGNISKLFLDKNIDFHILTLFEYSNIGNSEHIIRILKQILRYFPFKEDIWEKLAGVYRSYGK